MDKLELSLTNKTGDQGMGQDTKDEEVETPENLSILRQRKMVTSGLFYDKVLYAWQVCVCMHVCAYWVNPAV